MAPSLDQQFVHLGPGASAVVQPECAGPEWYAGYDERHAAEGVEGRLVSLHRFTGSWSGWEMHPHGTELVVCTEGRMTLVQETPSGTVRRLPLGPGEYAINPPGCWHTADIDDHATALFITAGLGTEHRPR